MEGLPPVLAGNSANSIQQADGTQQPSMRPRILSLSTVFPSPDDPRLGLFVRSRLLHLAELCDIRVLSPIPAIDWAKLRGKSVPARGGISGWITDEGIQVAYPRWCYPPGGGAVNGFLMAAQLAGKVRRLRQRFPFDVIDAHFGHPDGVAAAALARGLGCPFLVTLRGNETAHARHGWRRRAMRWALRRASRVITVSRRLADFAADLGVERDRIRTIGNGVNSEVFRRLDRSACRRKHGIGEGIRVILSAGYLIERKGHHRIVRALRGLPADVQLWIAGGPGREGIFESSLRALAAEPEVAGRVRFLGSVPPEELAELMNAADVLCLASSREGWPNVVHEALSCGTPVVAAGIGAVPDMIPDSRYGIVVAPGDERALADALGVAAGRSWDREAIAAWGQSRGWRQVAEEVFEEVRAVIGGQGNRAGIVK